MRSRPVGAYGRKRGPGCAQGGRQGPTCLTPSRAASAAGRRAPICSDLAYVRVGASRNYVCPLVDPCNSVSVNLFFTSFAKQARRSRKGGFTGCANVFHRFRSRLDGAVPRQVLQPVGPAGYLDQVAVVAHPVRYRARRHVVPEHLAPAADPHVGGDDRRALLVARRYRLEQQVRARAADVEVAELVDASAASSGRST